jgi:hypothetical protein
MVFLFRNENSVFDKSVKFNISQAFQSLNFFTFPKGIIKIIFSCILKLKVERKTFVLTSSRSLNTEKKIYLFLRKGANIITDIILNR